MIQSNLGQKRGVPIEKNVVITKDFVEKNEKKIKAMLQLFSAYPDIYLDLITPEKGGLELFFYQRITLRVLMRYQDVYITAPRAFSKSFLTILALILQCIFMPGTKRFICAPNIKQAAQIAKEKIIEIYSRWPMLKREIIGGDFDDTPGLFGHDYVTLKFRNGSQFDVVGARDSYRGGRRHGGLIDEVRDHDEDTLNTVVFPLMNVSRRTAGGLVNPNEPNQQRLCMTSAGVKTTFAYNLLLDMFEQCILDPTSSFVFGCDYRIPMKHGLVNRDYINKLKLSPSYNEESFAREYLSIWGGANDEAWFNFEKMTKYRKIKNPELKANFRNNPSQFYLISVDVGRFHDQSVCTVFRVNPTSEGKYLTTVVNIVVLGLTPETKLFTHQALDIKKLIEAYNPKEVVVDTNGLGVGLAEELIKEQTDEFGKVYPAYTFKNDKDWKKTQPKDGINILISLKAAASTNPKGVTVAKSDIHGNAYNRINSGSVRFLIKEQEAKNALLATKIGSAMSVEDRVRRLLPHQLTTMLFEEMANLRLLHTNDGTIKLEQINTRYPDDKYYSFAYGLWRIKELEEEAIKKFRRYGSLGGGRRKLVYFN